MYRLVVIIDNLTKLLEGIRVTGCLKPHVVVHTKCACHGGAMLRKTFDLPDFICTVAKYLIPGFVVGEDSLSILDMREIDSWHLLGCVLSVQVQQVCISVHHISHAHADSGSCIRKVFD